METISEGAPQSLADVLSIACERGGRTSGLVDADGTFTEWTTVHRQVQSLASVVVAAGVQPGDRVAVLHPRSTASFVAVHAVLAARAVMVPLDPLGPTVGLTDVLELVEPAAIIGATTTMTDRIADYLTASSALIVNHGDPAPLNEIGVEAARTIDFAEATQAAVGVELTPAEPDDVAYIIFTSGSTGTPKGVVHTHASGLAYAQGAALVHGLRPTDRMAATSPLHFDISTFDLYAVPLAGATAIAITEAELRFPASLTKRFEAERATVLFATPYQLLQMVERGDLENRDLTTFRQVAFGGEAFSPASLESVGRALPTAEFLNSYGPAETNGVIYHSFEPRPTHLESVPIGSPFPGVEVTIVINDQRVVPGEVGDLLISADSAMTGYWKRPDLDATLFVTIGGTEYYRTGDLAHVDEKGLVHFDGRADTRIKVRGVRIELEEIERVLGDATQVLHAVAGRIDEPAGMQHIAAWIVPANRGTLDEAALTAWCRGRLPTTAVPTKFIAINEVPTTPTGKIDRATLRASAVAPPTHRGDSDPHDGAG